ncbi:hypothetical protein [Pseudooceanicola sp. HF7]|uniref:hypothetical protein n=1 Tax=Pseudooceanicola sp. HF7 TaxID=2721560 RepID=UPI00142FE47C|nr:hypothetical protein [Pseudooceanicola sp. HF7]NIZ09157.1 hypothetical protein [Pseudooceanicola sp. HF7]
MRYPVLFPLLALPLPAIAAIERHPAQCAALWSGVVALADANPGIFEEMPNARQLAEDFTRMAGPKAEERIAHETPDYALIAKAALLQKDRLSREIFDEIAEDCAWVED